MHPTKKVYTFGYGNRKNHEALIDYCREKNITLVVDVRKRPRAWSHMWAKACLEKALPSEGIQYLSLPALGNNSGTKTWVPDDEAEALQTLSALKTTHEKETIAFMCAEMNAEHCHRFEVAQEFAGWVGLEVEHLL